MSKKDYQAIAAAIYESRRQHEGMSGEGDDIFDTIQGELALALKRDNPRFDHARFIEACETGKCRGMKQVA
jgi:hypothetical protein